MSDVQTFTSVVSAITALGAVIFGPFIAARAQSKGMLGPMRQGWINNLRDTLAEFAAAVSAGVIQTTSQMAGDDKTRHAAEDARKEHYEKTFELKEKIHLLINATEPEHIELVRLVEIAFQAYDKMADTTLPLRELRVRAQKVIKQEWNVVKGKKTDTNS